jgi:UDP-hydrolysing UDP-N-acetyl-D-glucosamine 2-epimerase
MTCANAAQPPSERQRSISIVTGSRAEYGLLRPVIAAVEAAPDLALRLMVCGTHLDPRFGLTVRHIEADGFPITERIATLAPSDQPAGIAESIASGVRGFAEAFARQRSDILVLLGDRYEMLAAATAALPFALPIAHIHGGELSEGVIDDAIRHALTKLSHLHFVATERYRERVIQLGEQPARVIVSGAPGIDAIRATKPTPRAVLEQLLGLEFEPSPLLVTFHPPTLDYAGTERQVKALLGALAEADRSVVFTYPGADTAARTIIDAIEAYAAAHANARVVKDLGQANYYGMMAISAAMIGNSSSGILEAPSFALPVVNIGDRQRGRLRAANVIDCVPERDAIAVAVARAVTPAFRAGLLGLRNPYGDGGAAERIVAGLRSVVLDGELIEKRFYDLPLSDMTTSHVKAPP